jgi:integrase
MERMRYLTKVECQRLLEQPTNNRDRSILRVLLYTGMRIGELAALKVRDFDFEERTIRIERVLVAAGKSLLENPNRYYKKAKPIVIIEEDGQRSFVKPIDLPAYLKVGQGEGGKGRYEFVREGTKRHGRLGRVVPLGDEGTWKCLQAEFFGRDREAWAWIAGPRQNGALARYGKEKRTSRLSWFGVRAMVIRAMKSAGIPPEKCHPHVTRHTFAVSYLKAGGTEVALQRIGGWSNITMLSVYADLVATDLVEMGKKLELGY